MVAFRGPRRAPQRWSESLAGPVVSGKAGVPPVDEQLPEDLPPLAEDCDVSLEVE